MTLFIRFLLFRGKCERRNTEYARLLSSVCGSGGQTGGEIVSLGIPAVEIFGLPSYKDDIGSSAWDMESPVQRAMMAIKKEFPDLIIVGDVCLCQYTDSGHCGQLCGHEVDNDPTLELLAKVAVSQAEAGADIIAPSDMMDGRISVIRNALDTNRFSHISVMSYAVKYASGYYGPFRDAADSAPVR